MTAVPHPRLPPVHHIIYPRTTPSLLSPFTTSPPPKDMTSDGGIFSRSLFDVFPQPAILAPGKLNGVPGPGGTFRAGHR